MLFCAGMMTGVMVAAAAMGQAAAMAGKFCSCSEHCYALSGCEKPVKVGDVQSSAESLCPPRRYGAPERGGDAYAGGYSREGYGRYDLCASCFCRCIYTALVYHTVQ